MLTDREEKEHRDLRRKQRERQRLIKGDDYVSDNESENDKTEEEDEYDDETDSEYDSEAQSVSPLSPHECDALTFCCCLVVGAARCSCL